MICKNCQTENEEFAVYCKDCGKRLDGKVKCTSCGKFTAFGKFCNHCGKQMPGTVRCETCGSVLYADPVEIKFGTPIKKRYAPSADAGCVTIASEGTSGADSLAPSDARTRNSLFSTVVLIAGLASVFCAFVFMFFTGFDCTATAVDGETSSASDYAFVLFHFFGDVYKTIDSSSLSGAALSAAKTEAVFGTIVSACMIAAVTSLTIAAIVETVKRFRHGEKADPCRYIVMTFFAYLAFCLMLQSLMTRNTEINGVVTRVGFDGATCAGIACSAALCAIYVVGRAASSRMGVRGNIGTTSFVMSLLTAAFLVAAMVLLSGRTTYTEIRYHSYTNSYKSGYFLPGIFAGFTDETALNCSICAQTFTFAFVVAAGFSCTEIFVDVAENKKKPGRAAGLVASLAAAALVAVFGVLSVAKTVDAFPDSVYYGEICATFTPLIVGASLAAVGIVLGFVSLGLSEKHTNARSTSHTPSAGPYDGLDAATDESE